MSRLYQEFHRTHANDRNLTRFLPWFEWFANKLGGASAESIFMDTSVRLSGDKRTKRVPVITQASLDWHVSARLFRICSWSAGLASNPLLPPITLIITLQSGVSYSGAARFGKTITWLERRKKRSSIQHWLSRMFQYTLAAENCFLLVWISYSSIHQRHPSVDRFHRRRRGRESATTHEYDAGFFEEATSEGDSQSALIYTITKSKSSINAKCLNYMEVEHFFFKKRQSKDCAKRGE